MFIIILLYPTLQHQVNLLLSWWNVFQHALLVLRRSVHRRRGKQVTVVSQWERTQTDIFLLSGSGWSRIFEYNRLTCCGVLVLSSKRKDLYTGWYQALQPRACETAFDRLEWRMQNEVPWRCRGTAWEIKHMKMKAKLIITAILL